MAREYKRSQEITFPKNMETGIKMNCRRKILNRQLDVGCLT